MKRRNAGFTLVELMVVLAITGMLAVMAIMGFREGLFREYGLSKDMRSVVNALHVAQWRALQNKISVIIDTGSSYGTADSEGWYSQVQFGTVEDHKFAVGDIIIFRNLTAHTDLNVGRYYVSAVDRTSTPYTFMIDWFTQVTGTDTDDSTLALNARPVAINMRTSSQLVLVKRSYLKAQNQATQNLLLTDPQYFVYNDNEMVVWDATNTTLGTTDVEKQEYQVTVAFDHRGFPSDKAGYQLALGKAPADMTIQKVVNVSPTGRIYPGKK